MTVEDAIAAYAHIPLRDSVGAVTLLLAREAVLVGVQGEFPPPGGMINLWSGYDNQGRPWIYAFTSHAEFAKAFQNGSGSATVAFRAIFRIVAADPRLAGIVINSASNSSYLFLRELFGTVEQSLRSAADPPQ